MNEIFKVNGYELDKEQKEVVLSNAKNILVIAGAGSGKSMTIIGKIKYLIYKQHINSNEILCISFTNDSCNSLKNNLLKNDIDIEVLTFHKLGLKILKENKQITNIPEIDILELTIDNFFNNAIYQETIYMEYLLKYKRIRYNIKNYLNKYNELINSKEIENIKMSISKFIHLYKSNGYSYSYIETVFNKYNNIFNKKYTYLLIIVIKILLEYQNTLKEEGLIDFDDIILESSKFVKYTKLNYKYIIIDEFQDTSITRYNLIKEILNKTNANFLAVGDDYQSIYRFTGCDLYLFINFKKYFRDSKIYKIQTTYRNSQELITIAGNFIKKNKLQINKNLRSNKKLSKPLKIIYYKNQKIKFVKLLEYLYKNNKKNILVLIRNNNDINKILTKELEVTGNSIKYKDMNIKYLTVHKSKGLEEETVIILNLINNDWGFPNKINDEKILKYILPKKERYKYAEERRLFYVALTRTKNELYLLTDISNPSIFVREIVNNNKSYIEILKLSDKI